LVELPKLRYTLSNQERDHHGKGSKSLHPRVQRGSGAARPDEWEADHADRPRAGISDTSIHQWRKELAEHGSEAFPGNGHQTKLEEENRRLKRELERVQQERDILKKVVSIFSRESK